MGSLKSYKTLKKNENFALVYKKGKKWHCKGAVVFYKKSSEKSVGFVASKKIGNAVKRSLAKRRLRAIFLKWQDSLEDGIYIFIAKTEINSLSYKELDKNLRWSFRKMELLK